MNYFDILWARRFGGGGFTPHERSTLKALTENPENHNGIYRGKNLTNVYTIEQIYERVHDGSFEDLYLGDYFTVRLTTDLYTRFTGAAFVAGTTYYEMDSGTDVTQRTWTVTQDTEPQSGKVYATKLTKTENVDLMIAAFDYYYNMGDTALTDHHVILIPRGAGFSTTAKMNDTNTTVGAYFNSDMHQIVLPCYAKSLKVALNNHLKAHRAYLTTVMNASTPSMAGAGLAGASTSAAWSTSELQLMNENQLIGSMIWSSSAYEAGCGEKQLPVFHYINQTQYEIQYFWLCSVANSSYFVLSYANGITSIYGAGSTGRVRPIIIFG